MPPIGSRVSPATTAAGALRSKGIGYVRSVAQTAGSYQAVSGAIRAAFPSLTGGQFSAVYQAVQAPYKAAAAATANPTAAIDISTLPIRRPSSFSEGLGTVSGQHYIVRISYTIPGDTTTHTQDQRVIDYRSRTPDSIVDEARGAFTGGFQGVSQSFMAARGGGQPTIVAATIHAAYQVPEPRTP